MTMEPKALELFQESRHYLCNLDALAYEAWRTTEEFLPGGQQKIHRSEANRLLIRRPARVQGNTVADMGDYQFAYNGSAIFLYHGVRKTFLSVPFIGNLDQLVDLLENHFHLPTPLFDLIGPNPRSLKAEKLTSARYLGLNLVLDQRCHHLACTQADFDWQLWIAPGEKPYPTKLSVNYKNEPGSPSLTIVVRKFDDHPEVSDELFQFEPPADAKCVDLPEVRL